MPSPSETIKTRATPSTVTYLLSQDFVLFFLPNLNFKILYVFVKISLLTLALDILCVCVCWRVCVLACVCVCVFCSYYFLQCTYISDPTEQSHCKVAKLSTACIGK